MVDAPALGAGGVTHGGSSPLLGTKKLGASRFFLAERKAPACFP